MIRMNKVYVKYILIFLFLAGVFFRVVNGNKIISSDIVYSKRINSDVPILDTPENVVKAFYLYIDKGNYGKAWSISIEPIWSRGNDRNIYKCGIKASCSKFKGWVNKEDFVRRCDNEIGKMGTYISISEITTTRVTVNKNDKIIKCINRFYPSSSLYTVQVNGRLLGACGVYSWIKYVPVIKVNSNFKVILSGEKSKNSLFYESWFSNRNRIANLRG